MDKIETENELNFKVINKNTNQTLIDESCCTLLTISLTNSGDIFTTFLGAYNEEILKLLKHTQKQYYKNLVKKLRASKHEGGPAEVTEEDHHLETSEPTNTKTSDANKTKTAKKKATTKKTTSVEKKTAPTKRASAPSAPKKVSDVKTTKTAPKKSAKTLGKTKNEKK